MAALNLSQLHQILLLIVPLLLFIFTLLLHYRRHFRARCCIRSKHQFGRQPSLNQRNSLKVHSNNLMRQIKRNESICRCCIEGADPDSFDFFPISFLLYNIYVILLTLLILSKYTIFIEHSSSSALTASRAAHRHPHNYASSLDWIIVYSLIMLSIWESLFNFYRFYSTYFASRKMRILKPTQILSKFLFFGVPFLVAFVLQIHLYYYLYPLIIACYFVFNIINVWLFGHILIVQYRFMMATQRYLSDIHDEMLDSVYTMRRVSMISSLCSSLYIALFTFSYDIHIIVYLPLLWSISSVCLTLNFVRNRVFIHAQLLAFKLCYQRSSCRIGRKAVVYASSPRSQSNNNNANNSKQAIMERTNANHVTLQHSHSDLKNGSTASANHNAAKPLQSGLRLTSIDSAMEVDEADIQQQYQKQTGQTFPNAPEKQPHAASSQHVQYASNSGIGGASSDIPSFTNNSSNSRSQSVARRLYRYIASPLPMMQPAATFEQQSAFHEVVADLGLSPIDIPSSPDNIYPYHPHTTTVNTTTSQPQRRSTDHSSRSAVSSSFASPASSSMISPTTRKKNKALKLLGIESSDHHSGANQQHRRQYSQNGRPMHPMAMPNVQYMPPTTPMPSLFAHLYNRKRPTFPAHVPPKQDELAESLEDEEEDEEPAEEHRQSEKVRVPRKRTETIHGDDNDSEENRDEFDDAEMAEIAAKQRRKEQQGMIRVSAKHPDLMIRRISTKLDNTPTLDKLVKSFSNSSTSKKHTLSSPSPPPASKDKSKSPRSPFARKKSEIEVSLLSASDHDPEIASPHKSEERIFEFEEKTRDLPPQRATHVSEKLSELKISMDGLKCDESTDSEDEPEPDQVGDGVHAALDADDEVEVIYDNGKLEQHMSAPTLKQMHTRSVSAMFAKESADSAQKKANQKQLSTPPVVKQSKFYMLRNLNLGKGKIKKSNASPRRTANGAPFEPQQHQQPQQEQHKRLRAKSDAKAKQRVHADIVIHSRTDTAPNLRPPDDDDPDPDVVGLFKVLAYHGFYDTKNVVSAQQLRDYNLKM